MRVQVVDNKYPARFGIGVDCLFDVVSEVTIIARLINRRGNHLPADNVPIAR